MSVPGTSELLHPGGRRFIVNDASIEAGRERFVVLLNRLDELERRVGR